MPHKVYLMRTERFIKIGITSGDIHKRLAAIQTGCPITIHTVQYWRTKTRDISLCIEKEIHKLLEYRNTHGEWFKNVSKNASSVREVLSNYGINFDDFKIIYLGRADVVSTEADDILNSINKCVKYKDHDRLIKLSKRIDEMPETLIYRDICSQYQDAILLLNKEF
jgi:hypothetical protein